jgi:hypothetical protein
MPVFMFPGTKENPIKEVHVNLRPYCPHGHDYLYVDSPDPGPIPLPKKLQIKHQGRGITVDSERRKPNIRHKEGPQVMSELMYKNAKRLWERVSEQERAVVLRRAILRPTENVTAYLWKRVPDGSRINMWDLEDNGGRNPEPEFEKFSPYSRVRIAGEDIWDHDCIWSFDALKKQWNGYPYSIVTSVTILIFPEAFPSFPEVSCHV